MTKQLVNCSGLKNIKERAVPKINPGACEHCEQIYNTPKAHNRHIRKVKYEIGVLTRLLMNRTTSSPHPLHILGEYFQQRVVRGVHQGEISDAVKELLDDVVKRWRGVEANPSKLFQQPCTGKAIGGGQIKIGEHLHCGGVKCAFCAETYTCFELGDLQRHAGAKHEDQGVDPDVRPGRVKAYGEGKSKDLDPERVIRRKFGGTRMVGRQTKGATEAAENLLVEDPLAEDPLVEDPLAEDPTINDAAEQVIDEEEVDNPDEEVETDNTAQLQDIDEDEIDNIDEAAKNAITRDLLPLFEGVTVNCTGQFISSAFFAAKQADALPAEKTITNSTEGFNEADLLSESVLFAMEMGYVADSTNILEDSSPALPVANPASAQQAEGCIINTTGGTNVPALPVAVSASTQQVEGVITQGMTVPAPALPVHGTQQVITQAMTVPVPALPVTECSRTGERRLLPEWIAQGTGTGRSSLGHSQLKRSHFQLKKSSPQLKRSHFAAFSPRIRMEAKRLKLLLISS
jgi:hypothetical protein